METVHKAEEGKADKKPPVERSAENPAISIEKGIGFVDSISKNFSPTQWISREDIEAVLKATGLHRAIAASVKYGLLSRNKNLYQISPLFKELINPISDDEVRKIKLQLFSAPKLYADLIEKFNGHVVPADLKVHLVRFHGIASKASAEVADLFFENARFAGVLNTSNILNIADVELKKETKVTPPDEKNEQPDQEDEVEKLKQKLLEESEKLKAKLLEEINNPKTYKIPLSEGKNAVLTYPTELNEKDIQILKKYIELLELALN